jgi:hypothetical protein
MYATCAVSLHAGWYLDRAEVFKRYNVPVDSCGDFHPLWMHPGPEARHVEYDMSSSRQQQQQQPPPLPGEVRHAHHHHQHEQQQQQQLGDDWGPGQQQQQRLEDAQHMHSAWDHQQQQWQPGRHEVCQPEQQQQQQQQQQVQQMLQSANLNTYQQLQQQHEVVTMPQQPKTGSGAYADTAGLLPPAISEVTADDKQQDTCTAAGMEADSAAAAAAANGASMSATPAPVLCLPITSSSSSRGLELCCAAWAAWLPQLALAPAAVVKVALRFRLLQQQQQEAVLLPAGGPVVARAARGADDTIRCA